MEIVLFDGRVKVLQQRALAVENLSVEVNGKLVIRNASLDVNPGEIVVLMGPNGSGKTSLLKTIMGLPNYRIKEGRILLYSKDITDLPPWERARNGIAIANQSPPPISLKTSWLFEKISNIYGTQSEIQSIVSETMIPHLLERPAFSGFSGGEMKRVEMATILLSKPKVALLDEPDSGVDIDSVKRIARLIDDLAIRGVAVLLVTHAGLLSRFLRKLGRGYIMIGGKISPGGDAKKMLRTVISEGYSNFSVEGEG